MHVNHRRRKNRKTHNGGRGSAYSFAWQKKQAAHDFRARERHLMVNEEWDDLPIKDFKRIMWEHW